jgi:hypothetical protein
MVAWDNSGGRCRIVGSMGGDHRHNLGALAHVQRRPRGNDRFPSGKRAGLAGPAGATLALLPPARDAGGMAKPIAKLLSMLTPNRRWAQFSLATMFVVVTVLCVWLAAQVRRANRQREVMAAIEPLGGGRWGDSLCEGRWKGFANC